jgi:hypothetical protein
MVIRLWTLQKVRDWLPGSDKVLPCGKISSFCKNNIDDEFKIKE